MYRWDRRTFLGTAVGGLAGLGAGSLVFADDKPSMAAASAAVAARGPLDTLFLTWQRDPTTTMTVQWVGPEIADAEATIAYAAQGKDEWQKITPRKTSYPMTDLRVYRAELTGLVPGSEYQFKIGTAPAARRFRTMPAKATDSFSFVSGGDCGVNEHVIANNIVAAKQDPMFALIGGDLGYDNGRDAPTSLEFVRNYSQHMIDTQGRLIPMVVCIGNHEVDGGYSTDRTKAPFYLALHDGLFPEKSYATLDFGDYLSLVLLDSGHLAPIGGEQTDWLTKVLAERNDIANLIAVNHVPCYPSVRPNEGLLGSGMANRKYWVPLFEKHNVDVVLEHHDHAFKRTHPLLNGHIDKQGIVYLGDGSWGKIRAPKRPEERPYLSAAHESYHLTLHRIEGEQRFHMALEETGKIVDVCMTGKRSRNRTSG